MTTLPSFLRQPFDRSFARRAATRMAASVAVMSALSAISHEEASDLEPFRPLSRSGSDISQDAAAFRQVVLAERASAKTDRLQRAIPQRQPVAVAMKAEVNGTKGVVLFDQCLPSCESRDPLLPGRTTGANETTPEASLYEAVSYEPEPPTPPQPVSTKPDGILGTVTSGLSIAAQSGQTIVGAVARLLP